METQTTSHDQPTQGTSPLATASLIVGIVAVLPFTYAWFFALMTWTAPQSTWYFGWLLVIGFHVPILIGVFAGLSSLILSIRAAKGVWRRGRARAGRNLGISAILLAVVYLGQYCVLGELAAPGGGYLLVMNWLFGPLQEITPPRGHLQPIESVAFSPDGSLIASGSSDGTVIVWDAATGDKLSVLQAGSSVDPRDTWDSGNDVSSVAFSPDGEILAAGSAEGMVRLWDVASGQESGAWNDWGGGASLWIGERVASVAFFPKGDLLAVGETLGRSVTVWDLDDQKKLVAITSDLWRFGRRMALSPDGKLLAVGGEKENGSAVVMYDAASLAEIRTFELSVENLYGLAFSPSGSLLAASGWFQSQSGNGQAIVWETSSGQVVQTIPGIARAVAFSPDGEVLAMADGGLRLWNLDTKEATVAVEAAGIIDSLAFSPDGTRLAYGFGGVIQILEMHDEQ